MTPKAGSPRVAAMLALLLASGQAPAAEQPVAPRAGRVPVDEPVREIRYSLHLRANPNTAKRYIVRGVCERDGVRQIAQLLRQSDLEEMWAFLPRADGTKACEWHEIGREERSRSERADLRVDRRYLMALIAGNSEVHLVHFHPLKYFECAAGGDCPKRAPAAAGAAADKRWITDLVFSMPSPSDVHFMMDITSRFVRHHQGRGTIRHKVVTPYGVVDYGLTAKGLARYDSERSGRTAGMYIPMIVASTLDNERIELVVREKPSELQAAVPRLARTLNTEFLRVAHVPAPGRRPAAGTAAR